MSKMNTKEIELLSQKVRKRIIEMSFKSGTSTHIGGALSMVEILSVLYGCVLNTSPIDPTSSERDRFILSKGHGVLGLYAILIELNFIQESVASTYMLNESELIAHPIKNLQFGIESSNGSLGQGLSYGSGLALGARLKNDTHKIFVLLGDGECNEGLVWEAANFAAQSKLNNLIAIVDCNGFQNDGSTKSISDNSLIADKWKSFGWSVIELNGHDIDTLVKSLTFDLNTHKPTVFIANTIKGKGVSFMESNNSWHHKRITETNYLTAMKELS